MKMHDPPFADQRIYMMDFVINATGFKVKDNAGHRTSKIVKIAP